MVLQNYQTFKEITSIMIYIVAFGVGLKCPHKIHLNTQWRGGGLKALVQKRGEKEKQKQVSYY